MQTIGELVERAYTDIRAGASRVEYQEIELGVRLVAYLVPGVMPIVRIDIKATERG